LTDIIYNRRGRRCPARRHVRIGSKAAATAEGGRVRFAPESSRDNRRPGRQLRANSVARPF
jgi:hypothetical protein